VSLRPSRRAVVAAVVIGVIVHTITTLWVWSSWGYFGRANVLTWIDFPVSLTYLHFEGEAMLAGSLVAGGLQWAAIAALLTLWVGSTTRRRRVQ
jgi:hypothetical protein